MANIPASRINIGFFGYNTKNWLGVINYLSNLLYAAKSTEDSQIRAVIFLKRKHDPEIIELFESLAEFVILDINNPVPFILKSIDRLFFKKTDYFTRYYLKKHRIDIVTQSEIDYKKLKIPCIGWIPDFQHIHLPEMFSQEELLNRDIRYKKMISDSDLMVVSSFDSAKDIELYVPGSIKKTRVLHFVSQIDQSVYQTDDRYAEYMEKKYQYAGKFFFLPNKFYRHKNHKLVFEAINTLKQEGIEILVICTGQFSAWESEAYINDLTKYLIDYKLDQNIKILGVIDYKEVQFFIRYAISVLNPSFFEGWSSSVEECKSLGKNMILSDIAVHREQNPPDTIYFNPKDVKNLTDILRSRWLSSNGGPDYKLEAKSIQELPGRIKEFGESYIKILNEVI